MTPSADKRASQKLLRPALASWSLLLIYIILAWLGIINTIVAHSHIIVGLLVSLLPFLFLYVGALKSVAYFIARRNVQAGEKVTTTGGPPATLLIVGLSVLTIIGLFFLMAAAI